MILVSIAPMLATLLALLVSLPFALAYHRRAATLPLDSLPRDGWALGLLEALDDVATLLDVDAAWLACDATPARTGSRQRMPHRTARAVQRSRQHHAAWALAKRPATTVEPCPATQRTPYAPPGWPLRLAA